VRVKTYNEAVRLARSAGEDAANRRAGKAGRSAWSAADHEHAVRVTEGILRDLGFDTARWIATAGLARNEPEAPPSRKKSKGRSRQEPVQLSFGFA